MNGPFLPTIGAPDPGALAYLNEAWELIPEHAEFRRYLIPPAPLKDLIRREAEAIRLQERFRNAVVAAVEQATGTRRPEGAR